MEIEKKWLLQELPEKLYTYPSESIEQGYVMVTENEELRIRKKEQSFFLTFKKGSGTTRQEIEIGISREQYDEFKKCIIGTPIHKRRVKYPYRGHTVEIDVYKGPLEGLIVAEVEFGSHKSMNEFRPPAWFGEDVSRKKEFKNKSLALEGFPSLLLREWKGSSRPSWHFKQSGVIPFRRKDGGYEVLLITTRRSGNWILPKGIIEPDLTPSDSAIKEAFEEAGVSGVIAADIHGTYAYDKWNGRCDVTLYPLEVTVEHANWPEGDVRERKWVPQGHIENYLENKELREAVFHILSALSEFE
jgi:adenylate cyclase